MKPLSLSPRLLRLLPAAALVGLALAILARGGLGSLSPAGLATHAQAWRAAAQDAPVAALATYVGTYAVATAAGLPVALALTLAGGAIFGAFEGAIAAILAANLAAMIAYGAARSALGPWIAVRLDHGGAVARLIAQLRARGFWPILAARLMPVMPFPLVNLAAGLAEVPLRTYAAATLLGGLPSGVIYASLGAGLGVGLSSASLGQAARSPWIWAPLLGLSVASTLPILLRRRCANRSA